MFQPICAYCGKAESFYAQCDFRLAVLACDDSEHQRMAERDAKSWLHKNGRVRREDYTQDPLFHDTDLLTRDVHVPRNSGNIDKEGWKIRNPSYTDYAFVQYDKGKWYIPVIKEDGLQKGIKIQDIKLSLPEEKHALVDAFEAKLIQGFYLAESLAYDEAKRLQGEQDNSVVQGNIQPCIHPVYGVGRVFVPEEAVPAQGDKAET